MRKAKLSWRWMIRSLLLRRRQVVWLLILTITVFVTGMVIPVSIQKAVDVIVANRPATNLFFIALASLVAIVVETYATQRRRVLVNELGLFLERRIARLTFAHMMRVRIDANELTGGDAITKLQQSEDIINFFLHFLPTAIFDVGGCLVAIGLTIYYDVFIGSAIIVSLPLLAIGVTKRLNGSRQALSPFFDALGRQRNFLTETLHGLSTVKALAVEGRRLRDFDNATVTVLGRKRDQMNLWNGYQMASQLAGRMLSLLVVGIGCWRLFEGRITVGDLLALQLLSGRIAGPIFAFGSILTTYQKADTAIAQLDILLRIPRERASILPPLRAFRSQEIIIRDLELTYPGATRPALQGLDLDLPDRGVVALVGRNGSGKSTLVSILLGMRSNYTGSVAIGGRDLKAYDPRWLRSQCGVVNQDTVMFSGSVRANVTSGDAADDEALSAALRFADAENFVAGLADTVDTEIKAGTTLSGGQRQRLAIARAVIRDPRIAIFDEPGAFLDAEAAVALERRLTAWAKSRLLILVTHHLLATRTADRIIVLDDGRCVGNGTHDTLLTTSPHYAALWADYNRHEREMTTSAAIEPHAVAAE